MSTDRTRTRHPVEVAGVIDLAPHMRRVRLTGEALATMPVALPGQWVKVFFPAPADAKPHSRAYTIRRHDAASATLDLDFVLHGDGGGASRWVSRARVGEVLAVAGPREGYRIDRAADSQILVGDSTSLPAIAAILDALPVETVAHLFMEVTDHDEVSLLPQRSASRTHVVVSGPRAAGSTGQLERALRDVTLSRTAQAWVAGEALMVRRVRDILWEKGVPRTAVSASGYWREGVEDHRDRDLP